MNAIIQQRHSTRRPIFLLAQDESCKTRFSRKAFSYVKLDTNSLDGFVASAAASFGSAAAAILLLYRKGGKW